MAGAFIHVAVYSWHGASASLESGGIWYSKSLLEIDNIYFSFYFLKKVFFSLLPPAWILFPETRLVGLPSPSSSYSLNQLLHN